MTVTGVHMVNQSVKIEKFCRSIRKGTQQLFNICACLVLLRNVAFANPSDGIVVGGVATITNTPTELQINQSSNSALIEWKSFDIGTGETTRFNQPSSSAVALNRV